MVGDSFAALNSDTEFGLRMRMRALLAEREAAVNSGDPSPLADADAAVRRCLVIEAEQAYRQLLDGAGAVAGQVGERRILGEVRLMGLVGVLPNQTGQADRRGRLPQGDSLSPEYPTLLTGQLETLRGLRHRLDLR
jgi:hypothetical protein